tara:strand:- start:407 stop:1261 length:855 start_codon:yes stop_codon:yes gene_type:complete
VKKNWIKLTLPKKLYFFLRDLKKIFREALFPSYAPRFRGWYGMILYTNPPWKGNKKNKESIEKKFISTEKKILNLIKENKFCLSQFENKDASNVLKELAWRHYIVYWSSCYSTQMTKSTQKNFIEAGVADGLTIFFALSAAKENDNIFKAYLYDTWGEVELINPSFKKNTTSFEYLSLEVTKKNLSFFEKDIFFKQGLIPNTFNGENEPETVTWLHIDLNSSSPTLDTLNYFWEKIDKGGIILLDDYAQPAYVDTKETVDKWLIDKKDSNFIQMPTSQGIIFKT